MRYWEYEALEYYNDSRHAMALQVLIDHGVPSNVAWGYLQKIYNKENIYNQNAQAVVMKDWEARAVRFEREGKDYSARIELVTHGVPQGDIENYLHILMKQVAKNWRQEALDFHFAGDHARAIDIIKRMEVCGALPAEAILADLIKHLPPTEKLPDDPLERLTMTLEKLIKLERRK